MGFQNKKRLWELCKQIIRAKYSHTCYTCGAQNLSGSNLQTGFATYFRMTPDTGYIVDPTKLLKLIPKNPYNPTGNSL